jgi:cytochrome P450
MSKSNRREDAPPLPNGFELTELNPEFLRDPHPMLDRLREEAPRHVHRHAHFPEAPEGLYVTRIEDVRAVFADPSFQRDPRATPEGSLARAFAPASVMIDGQHGNLLYLDGAQHRRVRSLSFGGGVHACLGAPQARLEIETTLWVLAANHPRTRLAAPAVRDRSTIGFVGFRELRLSLS